MAETVLPGGLVVYDPTGIVEAEAQPLAPRVESLSGLRIGILDNSKWNAGDLLRRTIELLEKGEGGPFPEVRFYKKHSFSSNADADLIQRIVSDSEVVITAIGD